MSDLISRQDVLHWLDGCDYELKDWQRWKLKTMVRDIPSAEKAQLSEEDATSDLISRKKALDVIRALQTYKLFEGDDMILVDKAQVQTELMMLPSVQPERKVGRWIPTASEKGRHECSRCHEYAPCYQDGSEHLSTFCVLCGAKMERGEQE